MAGRILIADPSKLARTKLKRALAGAAYEVVEATTGEEALAFWRSQDFDLLISEVNLPLLDGFDVVRGIRQADSARAKMPIIFVTSQSDGDVMERGRQAGITGWVVKPFDGPALMDAISTLINMGR